MADETPSSYWTTTEAAVLVDQRREPGRLIIWWVDGDKEGYWEDDEYDVVYFDHVIDAEDELRKHEWIVKPFLERGVRYIISTAAERGLE